MWSPPKLACLYTPGSGRRLLARQMRAGYLFSAAAGVVATTAAGVAATRALHHPSALAARGPEVKALHPRGDYRRGVCQRGYSRRAVAVCCGGFRGAARRCAVAWSAVAAVAGTGGVGGDGLGELLCGFAVADCRCEDAQLLLGVGVQEP